MGACRMMLGAGPILWRAILAEYYPGRNFGESPPFSRARVEAITRERPGAMPASQKYYAAIDNLTASSIS